MIKPKTILSILVIDPDTIFVGRISTWLKSICRVKAVSTVDKATGCLANEPYDAVVINLDVGNAQSLENLRQFRIVNQTIPVVALTSNEDDEFIVQVLNSGAQEIVFKQLADVKSLRTNIKTAIARRKSSERTRNSEHGQREDFVAMLAHDLKTPVSGAHRIYELMLEGWLGTFSAGQVEVIEKLRESNSSLLQLIQNMLEVYSYEQPGQSGRAVEVELLPLLLDSVMRFNEQAIRNKVHITSKLPEQLGIIRCDEAAVKRVFQNVLDNAIKFSPQGGTVAVEASSNDFLATITITDNGPGIPVKHQTKLFDRFWLGGHDTKYSASTGLGLYLCKRILLAHGGSITCQSKVGDGTSFIISLPVTPTSRFVQQTPGAALEGSE